GEDVPCTAQPAGGAVAHRRAVLSVLRSVVLSAGGGLRIARGTRPVGGAIGVAGPDAGTVGVSVLVHCPHAVSLCISAVPWLPATAGRARAWGIARRTRITPGRRMRSRSEPTRGPAGVRRGKRR